MGAHSVSFERACGCVTAWIHTFLREVKRKQVNNMWTWFLLWRPSLSWFLSDQDLQVRRAHFLSGDSRPAQPDLETPGTTFSEAHMFWIWGILVYRVVCLGQQSEEREWKIWIGSSSWEVVCKNLQLWLDVDVGKMWLGWLLRYCGQWDLKVLKRQRLQHFKLITWSVGCWQTQISWKGNYA